MACILIADNHFAIVGEAANGVQAVERAVLAQQAA